MDDAPMDHGVGSLRVGLIGYGFAGKTFHAPLIGGTPGLTLAAVASSDPAKVHRDLAGVTVVADPRQLLARDDIDLVVVASPNDSHAPLARAALAAGKHVVVDKPFTLDLAEARDLIAAARHHDRLLSVFQNRRWDSDFLGIRRAIEDGVIGTVTHFESHIDRFRPEVRARWREQAGPGAGLWYDLGPHLVDQALQLFGVPAGVQASFAIQRPGAVINDWAHVLLEYGALRVILQANMLVAGGTARFTVHGDKGSLVKRCPDQQEAQLRAGMAPGAPSWGQDPDALLFWDSTGVERHLPVPAGDQRCYYAAVRDAVRGTGRNPVPPVQALAVMAVVETAAAAAQAGCTLPLPLSEEERRAWA